MHARLERFNIFESSLSRIPWKRDRRIARSWLLIRLSIESSAISRWCWSIVSLFRASGTQVCQGDRCRVLASRIGHARFRGAPNGTEIRSSRGNRFSCELSTQKFPRNEFPWPTGRPAFSFPAAAQLAIDLGQLQRGASRPDARLSLDEVNIPELHRVANFIAPLSVLWTAINKNYLDCVYDFLTRSLLPYSCKFMDHYLYFS